MKFRACFAVVFASLALSVNADGWGDYAQKIHGKDNSGNDIHCHSYEGEIDPTKQPTLIEHAMLSSAAYQDGEDAYGDVVRKDAYKETSYTPLSKAETEKYIAGSGLTVKVQTDASGNPVRDSMGNEVVTVCGNKSPSEEKAFNAVLFKDAAGNIVISYRGTEFKEIVDIRDDATQFLGLTVPQQYKDASLLLNAVLANTASENTEIICDGHSLGGGLVAFAMADNDIMMMDADGNPVLDENGNPKSRVTGNTYNAAGLSDETLDYLVQRNGGSTERIKNADGNIVNIRNQFDPVSYFGYHLGETYEVTWASSLENVHTPTNDHGIEHLTENMISAGGFDNQWNIINSPAGGNAPTTTTGPGSSGPGGTSTSAGSTGGYTHEAATVASTKIGAWLLKEASGLIDKQIAKITQKHPFIAEAMKALGINGQSITNTVVNIFGVLIKAPSLKAALSTLATRAIDGLKNMAASLIKWGLQKLAGLINNMVGKVLNWLENKLLNFVNNIKNPLLKTALGYAVQAYSRWKSRTGSVIIGNTVSAKIYEFFKNDAANRVKNNPGSRGAQVYNDIMQRANPKKTP